MSNEIDTASDLPIFKRPRRRVFQNTLFSILLKIQAAVFSYIITRLLLHAMAVEEFGLYSVLFMSAIFNLPMLVGLGIPNLLVRFIPELYSQSRYRTIDHVFKAVNLLQIGVVVILLVFAFIFTPQLATLIKFPNSESILRIFSVGLLAYILQSNIQILYSSLFKQRIVFIITFAYNFFRLIAIFYVTQYTYMLQSVVIVEIATFVISLLLYLIAYRQTIHPLVVQDPHRDEPVTWKRFTRYTGLSYIHEIAAMITMQETDLFLVTSMLGGVAVGFYGIARRITLLIHHVTPYHALRWVIEPLFYSEYSSSKPESVQFGYTLLIKTISFITIPVAIWLAMMARPVIVYLFEPSYADAAGILTIMALFLPIKALQAPLSLTLQNAERVDWLIYARTTAILKIIFALWLVPKGGLLAMVWISGLTILLQNVIFYSFTVIILKTRADLFGLLRLVINAVITVLLFLQIRYLFIGVVGVFLSALCFGSIYLVINLVHKTFRPDERAFINKHLPHAFWKF